MGLILEARSPFQFDYKRVYSLTICCCSSSSCPMADSLEQSATKDRVAWSSTPDPSLNHSGSHDDITIIESSTEGPPQTLCGLGVPLKTTIMRYGI